MGTYLFVGRDPTARPPARPLARDLFFIVTYLLVENLNTMPITQYVFYKLPTQCRSAFVHSLQMIFPAGADWAQIHLVNKTTIYRTLWPAALALLGRLVHYRAVHAATERSHFVRESTYKRAL